MINVFNCLLLFTTFAFVFNQDAPVLYDSYFGTPVSGRRATYLSTIGNVTGMCTVWVRPCRKNEGRRVDGTCANPRYPSRGATRNPMQRLLPPRFGPGNALPPASDGSELPSARLIRTSLLGDAFVAGNNFSILQTHFHEGTIGDIVDLLYLIRYGAFSTCCLGNRPNTVLPVCIPIPVPEDDPYLRASGIRCLNLTRVETFQDYFCLPPNMPAERFNRAPQLMDLSPIYGDTEQRNREIRAMQGGLLRFRMEGTREVPEGLSIYCLGNRPPEISCYNFGDPFATNLLPGGLLIGMLFFREHNRLARRLSELNPCWDDEKLFQTARQINIAAYQYIYFYELTAGIIGRQNGLYEGILYETDGYVNDFDPSYEPGVIHEFAAGIRFFHNYKPGAIDLYRNGRYTGTTLQPDLIIKSGAYAFNNTEADITEGSTIQPSARFDYIMDFELSHRYAGGLLRAADLAASDFMRGRDAGFPPYNQYRKLCGMKVAKEWEDYYDTIDKDKVEILRRLYEYVDDVELMVAIFIEKYMPEIFVGPTLYCIMVHNLLLWRKSDRFFFEHGDIPAALTLPQLNEIRKANMARITCDNGDKITRIQPKAFLTISKTNRQVSCSKIRGIDLSKWKDDWCPPPESGYMQSIGNLIDIPSGIPNLIPIGTPSGTPVGTPVGNPIGNPSGTPIGTLSGTPVGNPSGIPSLTPIGTPSGTPVGTPVGNPIGNPSGTPSVIPIGIPSGTPVGTPVGNPIGNPSGTLSGTPVGNPSGIPSLTPIGTPSGTPVGTPVGNPIGNPSGTPVGDPIDTSAPWPAVLPISP